MQIGDKYCVCTTVSSCNVDSFGATSESKCLNSKTECLWMTRRQATQACGYDIRMLLLFFFKVGEEVKGGYLVGLLNHWGGVELIADDPGKLGTRRIGSRSLERPGSLEVTR